jgi:alanine racemase
MTVVRSTVADVDLDAIVANMRAVARHGERVIAVVKADAYGHGAEVVAAALADAGAEMLAVFAIDEAIELRRSGIASPVLVLGGLTDPSEADAAVLFDLTVTVWDEERARILSSAASAAGATARVHVKVDTGLTRLGAPLDDALRRFRAIRAMPALAVDGFFTHFATADEPGDTFTAEQMRRFADVVSALPDRPRLVHAAASAGAALLDARGPANAVRCGLALYGLQPAAHLTTLRLRPALRWTSRVHRVARVPAGTGVSYGHEFRAARESVIATVPVGYGDGLPRIAEARARPLVRGRPVRIAGRIAMDLAMLDVTDVPEVREGDEVVVIGEQDGAHVTAEDLAAACGTINYEVVTNIRRRVARRYRQGGKLVAIRTLSGVERE